MLAAIFLLTGLSLGVVVTDPSPKTVQIGLTNGRAFKGEVLAVRESTLVLGTRPDLSPMEMIADPGAVMVVPFRTVNTIITASSSHALLGGLLGAPIGCLGGYGIGTAMPVERQPNDTFGCNAASEHADNQVTGMAVGTVVGVAVGCMIGQATGDKGQELITPAQRDFTFLCAVARYPQEEPETLKKIGR